MRAAAGSSRRSTTRCAGSAPASSLYQVHWPDPNTPIKETAGALKDLLEAGTIRAIGVSNLSPAQMDAFRAVQLGPVDAVYGWRLDGGAMKEIDDILADNIQEPVGPEFMAPPDKAAA